MSKNAVCANIANGDRSFMRQVKKNQTSNRTAGSALPVPSMELF